MSPETYLFYTFYIHICPWKQNYPAVLGRNFQNDFTTPGSALLRVLETFGLDKTDIPIS